MGTTRRRREADHARAPRSRPHERRGVPRTDFRLGRSLRWGGSCTATPINGDRGGSTTTAPTYGSAGASPSHLSSAAPESLIPRKARPKFVRSDSAAAAGLGPGGDRPVGPTGPRVGASRENGPPPPRASATRSRPRNGRPPRPAAPPETPVVAAQQPEQPGHVAAEFQNHERGSVFAQFIAAVGQRAGFPDADARLGHLAPQRHGPAPAALTDDQPCGGYCGRMCCRGKWHGVSPPRGRIEACNNDLIVTPFHPGHHPGGARWANIFFLLRQEKGLPGNIICGTLLISG